MCTTQLPIPEHAQMGHIHKFYIAKFINCDGYIFINIKAFKYVSDFSSIFTFQSNFDEYAPIKRRLNND